MRWLSGVRRRVERNNAARIAFHEVRALEGRVVIVARHLIGYFEERGRAPPVGDNDKPAVGTFLGDSA